MISIFNPFKFRHTKKIVFYFLLFCLFDNSIYASENFGDAMKWYKNRSLDSDPKYHYMIGLKAEQEELIKKAIKHFSLAAEKDYTLAQIKLSSYLEKSNEENDNKKARIIYKRLSDKKYPNAALRLGWMFENNFGGEKDYSSALKFYKIAASRDENEAYLYLSNLFLTSFDEKSFLQAVGYASIAKDKKVKGADKLLESLMPLLNENNLSELEVLIYSLESEIAKIKFN